MANSHDFPALLATLAGVPVGTDEGKAASIYAGTTGLSMTEALQKKAGKKGLDPNAALASILGVGTRDANSIIKKQVG